MLSYSKSWLFLFFILASPAMALLEEGGSGLALCAGAGIEMTAPSGWVFDNETGRGVGMDTVIYPVGESWYSGEPPIIYAEVTAKQGRSFDVTVTESQDRSLPTPGREIEVLTSADGRRARVTEFRAESRTTVVAQMNAPGFLCRVVLEAPDQEALARGLPAFRTVVRSSRFFGPKSADYQAAVQTKAVVSLTTDFQNSLTHPFPKGWKLVSEGEGVTVFQRTTRFGFGTLGVYNAVPGKKDPTTDFESAWRELAEGTFYAGRAPKAESRFNDADAFMMVGKKIVDREGSPMTVTLAVFSFYDRRAAVLAAFSDQTMAKDVEDFIEVTAPFLPFASGDWTSRKSEPRESVDGEIIILDDEGWASRSYRFGKDAYTHEGEIYINKDRVIRFEEHGAFSVEGGRLALRSTGGIWRELDGKNTIVSSRELAQWDRTYNFKLIVVPGVPHNPYLILYGVEENDLDGCYGTFFPGAFVYILGYH
ncbi:MAG TPA: hypothetical protein EYO33_12800 [Phycisphaerales bacterium]|nr:hypothetical protein [Phycisphaerales bacterium]